jgi:predicted CXXCH cytochrome family protein
MVRTVFLQLLVLSSVIFVDSGGAESLACRSCHSRAAALELASSEVIGKKMPADLPVNLFLRHCQNCHGMRSDLSQLSPGHRLAAQFYHHETELLAKLGSSEACRGCHSPSGDGWGIDLAGLRAPRFHDAATHPMGAVKSARISTTGYNVRKKIDRRIRLVGGKIACLSCHSLTEATDARLVRFDAAYDLCLGCHIRGSGGGNSESLTYFR